jgi:predicted small lipoprotein YifL
MLRSLLLCLLIASSLAACGNKGPLVLPDQAAQKDKDKNADKDKPAATQVPNTANGDSTKH